MKRNNGVNVTNCIFIIKQEASSKKKISDEEYQVIVSIFFQYYNRGS